MDQRVFNGPGLAGAYDPFRNQAIQRGLSPQIDYARVEAMRFAIQAGLSDALAIVDAAEMFHTFITGQARVTTMVAHQKIVRKRAPKKVVRRSTKGRSK